MENNKEFNVTVLQIGTEYTYKELCNLLHEECASGNKKARQLKEWDRYFEYNKEGTKYLIKSIRSEPLPPLRRGKYAKYLEDIFFRYLLSNNKKTGKNSIKIYSYSQLWLILGMVNEHYKWYMDPKHRNEEEIKKFDEYMTPYEMNEFYDRSKEKFRSVINSMLSRLENRCLIGVKESYTISYQYLDEYRTLKQEEPREATNIEVEYWLDASRNTLNEMGYDKLREVFLHKKQEEFYTKVEERLKEFFPEYENISYYKYKEIIYKPYLLEDELKKNKSKASELDQTIMKFNNEMVKALNKQAARNYKEHGKESEEANAAKLLNGGILPEEQFFYPKSYVRLQEKLTDRLIKITKKEVQGRMNNNE